MKTFLKITLVSMTIGLSISANNFIFAENNEEVYLKEDKVILEGLNSNLTYAPKTGNVNLDYLYQMIQHHKSGIDMAKNLLNNGGENEEVAQIAKDIIKNQTISIANMEKLMQTLINNLTQDKASEEKYLKEYEQTIKEMMIGFEKLQPIGSVDKDFLQTMIVHHQGAIGMANSIIKYSDNNEIKNMANEELKSQQPEIENMKKLLEGKSENKDKNQNNTQN